MFHTLGIIKYRPTTYQSNMNISVLLLSIILMAVITTVTAEGLKDQAMKYYTECQAEKAQASASKPSLSSFGSKGASMGSAGGFRIDECPKDQETKCDLGCVLKKLGAEQDGHRTCHLEGPRWFQNVPLRSVKTAIQQVSTDAILEKPQCVGRSYIKNNQLLATETKNLCKANDPAKKKKLDDAIDACAKKVGTQKDECEAGAAVCKCVMEVSLSNY
ncbi:unnamed protein product [Timema podura]|uniref:Uncharacterized protein n=1 Tax=Timema podura TaxID=61482 RepID=A0ABN7NKZ4_TIMPD|nr:unnamed protein product [Timema podura]